MISKDFNPPTLFIIGMPLDENAELPEISVSALQSSQIIIGESRKMALRHLKKIEHVDKKELFFLEPFKSTEWKSLQSSLGNLKNTSGIAALFSDSGMPILFDPGKEVLDLCNQLGFSIRTIPGPTSWASACSVSGFLPPFLILGFPPQKTKDRAIFFSGIQREQSHLVLLDTPYRFRLLLEEALRTFGTERGAFLAWEIAMPGEKLIWGNLASIEKQCQIHHCVKGEFVLIISGRKAIREKK